LKKDIIFCAALLFISLNSPGFAQNDKWPILKGPYLGQKPPGMTPEIFAPGIVSLADFHDFKGAFSPDGKEYYFCRHSLPKVIPTLFFTKIVDGVWTEPTQLPIAKGNRTFHPCISSDNQWLLFYWQFDKGLSQKSGYYASARTDTGWSVPRYAGQGMCLTADNSGFFYANEMILSNPPKFYMNKVTFRNGLFVEYERLQIDKHYGKQTHPCIAPSGSYIIFDTQDKNSKLCVCFKDKKGHWGGVIDLTRHGLQPGARNAYISLDEKYLFYGFKGDIWWVDIKVIESLRPKQ